MATDAIDGSLVRWEDISQRHVWGALLLGNGLSINVWPRFAYASLFDSLSRSDRALFDGTQNFERTLSDLMTAMRVNSALGIDTAPILDRYRSIQVALGHAIQGVHIRQGRIPEATLATIREEMLRYEWIFTTSYDLVLYWAMKGRNGWKPFVDFLPRSDDGRCAFDPDPERTKAYAADVATYFLHGALHLVVGGDGITWKRTRVGLQGLLAQFGRPIDGDPRAPAAARDGGVGS